MKLLPEEDRRVQSFLVRYSQHKKFREMRHYIQHGRISTLEHCISVAKASLWLSRHLHMRVDEKALLTGALLHDFYLYDWHKKMVIMVCMDLPIRIQPVKMPDSTSTLIRKNRILSVRICGH